MLNKKISIQFKENSNPIELTVHTSSYCFLDFTLCWNYKLSKGEICVANFIILPPPPPPPEWAELAWNVQFSQNYYKIYIQIILTNHSDPNKKCFVERLSWADINEIKKTIIKN